WESCEAAAPARIPAAPHAARERAHVPPGRLTAHSPRRPDAPPDPTGDACMPLHASFRLRPLLLCVALAASAATAAAASAQVRPAPSTSTDGTLLTISDRKSTRLNSSHVKISYAVFCLKKKKNECSRL